MAPKPKQKKATTSKTAQIGGEKGLTISAKPRTQVGSPPSEVHGTSDDAGQEVTAMSAVSKKKRQEQRMREETSMLEQVLTKVTKLQIPTTARSETGSESEVESDSLGNSEEEEEEKKEEIKGDIKDILLYILDELKAIRRMQNTLNYVEKQKMDNKVKEMAVKMEEKTERIDKIEDNNLAWTIERKRMLEKIDALENSSRQNNIKIVGLLGGTEGENPIKFFQEWIPKILEMKEGSRVIEIERAHRALRPRPQQDQNPRSILIKCLRYQDKEMILKAATQGAKKRNGPLTIEGKRVFFYPDISYDLLKRRKEFNLVKKIFMGKGL
ncbi:syntaxin-binding protein 6 isoform X1 [Hypanus sabinus]|uniref:syntaxin-binding protein 6 isoform X1 n=1 Tax=Hypanus sabinus TaxID=79690 RepID=UPI0028C3ECAF|nr:syntaxin-binding protein 6 isoform X1 [Hypanus sabinus]